MPRPAEGSGVADARSHQTKRRCLQTQHWSDGRSGLSGDCCSACNCDPQYQATSIAYRADRRATHAPNNTPGRGVIRASENASAHVMSATVKDRQPCARLQFTMFAMRLPAIDGHALPETRRRRKSPQRPKFATPLDLLAAYERQITHQRVIRGFTRWEDAGFRPRTL